MQFAQGNDLERSFVQDQLNGAEKKTPADGIPGTGVVGAGVDQRKELVVPADALRGLRERLPHALGLGRDRGRHDDCDQADRRSVGTHLKMRLLT